MTAITLGVLKSAVAGNAAAFRRVVELQPAGGNGDKIFPPTYMSGDVAGVYANEKRRVGDEIVDCVLLDSVQSQANRMELALLDAWRNRQKPEDFPLPIIIVDFKESIVPDVGQITSLELPHRIADAILRDSLFENTPFRETQIGLQLNQISPRNATPLFAYCPTALLFGMWDSAGPRGGMGAKFARAIVSEITGVGVVQGVRTSSRIDPLQIYKESGPVYRMPNGDWTLDADKAAVVAKKKKELRPSEVNHGNIPPTVTSGGVTIEKAIQTTVLSLPALRRQYFPVENDKSIKETDDCARTVLAALALCAATLATEQGYDLRSRCQLIPITSTTWELLGGHGEASTTYSLSARESIELFKEAVEEIKTTKLPWSLDEITLQPRQELAKLVKNSHELAAKTVSVEGGN